MSLARLNKVLLWRARGVSRYERAYNKGKGRVILCYANRHYGTFSFLSFLSHGFFHRDTIFFFL